MLRGGEVRDTTHKPTPGGNGILYFSRYLDPFIFVTNLYEAWINVLLDLVIQGTWICKSYIIHRYNSGHQADLYLFF